MNAVARRSRPNRPRKSHFSIAEPQWLTGLGQEENTPAGCSKRPSSKAAASEEAMRTLRYVEPLSEARTKLEDFFSILLSPPGLLASKADPGVLVVRRGGRTRKAPPGERIERHSRHSWIVRARANGRYLNWATGCSLTSAPWPGPGRQRGSCFLPYCS